MFKMNKNGGGKKMSSLLINGLKFSFLTRVFIIEVVNL